MIDPEMVKPARDEVMIFSKGYGVLRLGSIYLMASLIARCSHVT